MNDATRALNPELFPPSPSTRLLDQLERAPRDNAKNDGRGFQKELEVTAGGYQSRRIAALKKVDPPCRIIWPIDPKTGERRQRVIFMENPFLDYVGSWTAHGGMALQIEAKSTAGHRLQFNKDNGFKSTQWAAMKFWRLNLAACALVWQWNGRVALFTPEMLLNVERLGAASLAHEDGLPVNRGTGSVLWDFLRVLEEQTWKPKVPPPAPKERTEFSYNGMVIYRAPDGWKCDALKLERMPTAERAIEEVAIRQSLGNL